MSLLGWLKRAFQPPPSPDLPMTKEPEGPPPDEILVRGALATMGQPNGIASTEGLPPELYAALFRIAQAGRENTAVELHRRLYAARPNDLELAARLAELLCARLEHTAAVPILERLVASPSRLRAHFLLGDALERVGDEIGARRHFEAILARDLDYPQARARADRLRSFSRPTAAPTTPVAPTMAGIPDGGAGLVGRYRLLREIGRGASGAVYVAHDESLDRDLALKILHPQTRVTVPGDPRARAWAEARIAAAIRHPGVVAIYDLDEERQLLAMELCAGGSLKDRLSAGSLAPLEAVHRLKELLATLEAVHRRGVVHGDLKPANLLFRDARPDADLVLGDFGLARLALEVEAKDADNTRGTLAYMAPEQRRGELTKAADRYAAGVIAFELFAGSRALEARLADRAALLRGEMGGAFCLPDEARRSLGAALGERTQALISALLHPDPERRPSAEEAARALSS